MATTNDDGVETIPLDDILDGSETTNDDGVETIPLRRKPSSRSRMLSKSRSTMQHLAFYGNYDGRYSLFFLNLAF